MHAATMWPCCRATLRSAAQEAQATGPGVAEALPGRAPAAQLFGGRACASAGDRISCTLHMRTGGFAINWSILWHLKPGALAACRKAAGMAGKRGQMPLPAAPRWPYTALLVAAPSTHTRQSHTLGKA